MGSSPLGTFARNQAWLTAVLIAGDLLAWMKGLCLPADLQHAEPKRLRYTFLHAAGRLGRSGRRTLIRMAQSWPWAASLLAAFRRCAHLTLGT